MTWDWHDIEKKTPSEMNVERLEKEKAIQAATDKKTAEARRLQAAYDKSKLPKLPEDTAANKPTKDADLDIGSNDEERRNKLKEEGKNVSPAPNLANEAESQRTKVVDGLFAEDDKKKKEIDNAPSAPTLPKPPKPPQAPKPPKESLSSKAKRLATKAKKVKGKIATSYGDSLIRFGKKNLKPSGNPRRIKQKTGSRHPNLKVLNKPKTHLSNKVKEQLKPDLME